MRRPWFYSLTRKFTALSACLVLASMAAIGALSYQGFSRAVDKKVERLTDNLLLMINKNVNYMTDDVRDTSNLIVTSRAIQEAFTTASLTGYTHEFNQSVSDMQDLFNNMINNKRYISFVYAGNPNYQLISRKGRLHRLNVALFDFDDPPGWVSDARARAGGGAWFRGEAMLEFGENMLVYARQIRSLNRLHEIGLLAIGIDGAALTELFSDVDSTNHLNVVIRSGGDLLFRYDSTSHSLARLNQTQREGLLGTSGFVDLGNDQYYFVRSIYNQTSGWDITAIIPYDDFNQEKHSLMNWIVLLTALTFAGTFALSYLITRGSITKTLSQLRGFVEQYKGGRSPEEITFTHRDEVGVIGEAFLRVAQENEQLSVNLYKSLYKEKEAELIALQAQINPHFLYNTLDSIFWVAQEYGAEDIARMAVALSSLFRLSLNRGRSTCTLRSELELVNHYLTIQNMRYDNRYIVSVDVPEAVLELTVAKLMLQPVVENAICHGLEGKDGEGHIRISAHVDGDTLILRVTDDGIGFEPDPDHPLGQGYALRNIDERIKLYYGEDCGVCIRSAVGEGTEVVLKLKTAIPKCEGGRA